MVRRCGGGAAAVLIPVQMHKRIRPLAGAAEVLVFMRILLEGGGAPFNNRLQDIMPQWLAVSDGGHSTRAAALWRARVLGLAPD